MHARCACAADSYDLSAVEGVNNILKSLGPAVKVAYNGTNFYFTQWCTVREDGIY